MQEIMRSLPRRDDNTVGAAVTDNLGIADTCDTAESMFALNLYLDIIAV